MFNENKIVENNTTNEKVAGIPEVTEAEQGNEALSQNKKVYFDETGAPTMAMSKDDLEQHRDNLN